MACLARAGRLDAFIRTGAGRNKGNDGLVEGKTRETMDYNDYILWESNVAMENGTFIVDSHRNHGFYHGFSREIR